MLLLWDLLVKLNELWGKYAEDLAADFIHRKRQVDSVWLLFDCPLLLLTCIVCALTCRRASFCLAKYVLCSFHLNILFIPKPNSMLVLPMATRFTMLQEKD